MELVWVSLRQHGEPLVFHESRACRPQTPNPYMVRTSRDEAVEAGCGLCSYCEKAAA